MNIKISKGTKEVSSSENESPEEEFLNMSNYSLDHFEINDDNKKANFNDIKLNEANRKKEQENKDMDDEIIVMKQLSSQYANTYANAYKSDDSMQYGKEIKKRLFELQEELKGQIEEIKQLKSQQQPRGLFYLPQTGFQNPEELF